MSTTEAGAVVLKFVLFVFHFYFALFRKKDIKRVKWSKFQETVKNKGVARVVHKKERRNEQVIKKAKRKLFVNKSLY